MLQGGSARTAQMLAEACRVSRRTIFRDLEVLREAGVPLIFHEAHQGYQLLKEQYLPPTNFTTEEALALIVLCQQLGGKSGLPFYAAARGAALKLESTLPGRLRDHLQSVTRTIHIQLQPQSDPTGSEPIYQQILAAIVARRCVRVTYDSFMEGQAITTKLSPYRVLFSRRSWYCIARSSLHREVRTFNVNRLTQLEMLDDTYEIPQRFSLERYLRNAWHLIPEPGDDQEVLVRFQPRVARNVGEILWHKTQRLEWQSDGCLDFRVTVSGLQEISWWILGYGDEAEALEPAPLRALIAQHVRNLAAKYQVETTKPSS